jgi:hypothetical protein
LKSKPGEKARNNKQAGDLLGLLRSPENGGSTFIQNIDTLLPGRTASQKIEGLLFIVNAVKA